MLEIFGQNVLNTMIKNYNNHSQALQVVLYDTVEYSKTHHCYAFPALLLLYVREKSHLKHAGKVNVELSTVFLLSPPALQPNMKLSRRRTADEWMSDVTLHPVTFFNLHIQAENLQHEGN